MQMKSDLGWGFFIIIMYTQAHTATQFPLLQILRNCLDLIEIQLKRLGQTVALGCPRKRYEH